MTFNASIVRDNDKNGLGVYVVVPSSKTYNYTVEDQVDIEWVPAGASPEEKVEARGGFGPFQSTFKGIAKVCWSAGVAWLCGDGQTCRYQQSGFSGWKQ